MALVVLIAPSAVASETSYGLFVTAKKAGDTASAELLNTLFSQQLATTAGVKMIPFHGAMPAPPAELVESIEAGYRALNAAVTEPDKAASDTPGAAALVQFDKAMLALQRLQAAKGMLPRRAIARLYKGMAVAFALNKQGPRAQPFIHDTLNLWPDQGAREYAWNVEVSNLFAFVEKRRSDSVDVGKIAIDGLSGATVRVNGKSAGGVPLTVDRLRPGQHFVEVTRHGYRPMHALVAVKKDETTRIEAQLQPLPEKVRVDELVGRVAKQRSASKATPLLSELAKAAGVQRVLVLTVTPRKKSWSLAGFTGGEGETRQHKATITRDAQMVAGVQGLIEESTGMKPGTAKTDGTAGRLDGPPASSLMRPALKGKTGGPKVGAGVEDTEFYETWWFWTAVGGGVAIITTAVVLAVVLSDEDESPKTGSLDITLNPL